MSYIDQSVVRIITQYLFNISSLLGRDITLEKAAMLGRTIVPSTNWYLPHETLSVTEHAAFHLLSYYRFQKHWLETESNYYGVDVASVLEVCKRVIVDITSLIPENNRQSDVTAYRDPNDAEIIACNRIRDNAMLRGRSFCISEAERYCNIMHQAQKGDAIAAFQGTDRLYVLRQVGDKYQLIGDAYVDGLMLGEAYRGLNSEETDYDIALV
jgi:hypothetical protein